MGVDDHVVLVAGLAPVHRGRAGGRTIFHRPQMARVDRRPGQIQYAGRPQFSQEHLVQALPDPGLVPLPQSPPYHQNSTVRDVLICHVQAVCHGESPLDAHMLFLLALVKGA